MDIENNKSEEFYENQNSSEEFFYLRIFDFFVELLNFIWSTLVDSSKIIFIFLMCLLFIFLILWALINTAVIKI